MRLEVCLTLLSTKEGGRAHPLAARHAMCWIGNMVGDHKHFNDAHLRLIGREAIAPGETIRAYLDPFAPEHWSKVESGWEIDLYDGRSWRIGRAVVLNVSDETDWRSVSDHAEG